MRSVPLREVCNITMGQAPPGDSYNVRGLGLPLIAGAGDFSNGKLAPTKFTTQPSKRSADRDIILSIRASVGAKVWADGEYCLGRGVAGLRAGRELDRRFLWHWLSHSEAALAAKGRGATFLQVNRADIGEMAIDLPSLPEQRRIAAILDQADALRAQRRQVLAHLDTLIQSAFHAMFGDAGGPRMAIGDFAEVATGSTPSRDDPDNFGGTTPWVKTGEVQGIIHSTSERVTEKGMRSARLKVFPADSVVIAMYGQGKTRGQSAVLGVPATTNQACAVILPNGSFDSHFLQAQLALEYDRLRGDAEGGNQPNLSLGRIQRFTLHLPSIAHQRAFAGIVGRVRAQTLGVVRALAADDELFDSLQTRAFRGEL